jgi:prepilin-type N-terminal cleavage/methylation domain-containing protein
MNFVNDNQPETTRLQDYGTTGPRNYETTGSRFTFHVSRLTHHASRINAPTHQRSNGFTLIELLIVVSIIAILAALVFPVTGAVNRAKIRSRAKGELGRIELAIEAYKAKYGVYPPDNPGAPGGPAVNQLYYELMGTTNTLGNFTTLDGSASIARPNFPTAFGANTTVGGFVNCSKGGGGDETKAAKDFLQNLKPGQYMAIPNSAPVCTVLGSSLDGPLMFTGTTGKINPWRYVSSGPTNNPTSYDLWIDVLVGGKTNRISNWSREPLIVDN